MANRSTGIWNFHNGFVVFRRGRLRWQCYSVLCLPPHLIPFQWARFVICYCKLVLSHTFHSTLEPHHRLVAIKSHRTKLASILANRLEWPASGNSSRRAVSLHPFLAPPLCPHSLIRLHQLCVLVLLCLQWQSSVHCTFAAVYNGALIGYYGYKASELWLWYGRVEMVIIELPRQHHRQQNPILQNTRA